jgi:hypothetical protein
LNKFITFIHETSQKSFVLLREHEYEYEDHGSAEPAVHVTLNPDFILKGPPTGIDILADSLISNSGSGVRTSVFSENLTSLHYLLQLHGFSNTSSSVRECKIMLAHHLLNGDCLRFGHICESTSKSKVPDRTACRILSDGFSQPLDMTKAVVNIVVKASAKEFCNDRLLILTDAIGMTDKLKLKRNIRRVLIHSLEEFCSRIGYRNVVSAPSADVFHDLFFGFERCNTGTLKAIMARHCIVTDEKIKIKRDDMKKLILDHISNGHCLQQKKPQDTDLHEGCKDVHSTVDRDCSVSDLERKIKILEYLKDNLVRVPMLQLMKIQDIAHDPLDSLKTLREKLDIHIETLRVIDQKKIADAWPQKVSSNLKEKIINLFLKETSSKALSTFVCASCAENCLLEDKTCVKENDISLKPLYRPDMRSDFKNPEFTVDENWLNPACVPPEFCNNGIDANALLDQNGIFISDTDNCKMLSFCSECYKSLEKGKTPPLSLANHMIIGEIPKELQELTMVEEAIIARCRAKTWVVQLQEKNDKINLPNIQRGFKGHTIIYPQKAESIAQILPPSIADVCTPICVIFIGSQRPTKEWLKNQAKPLVVRREKIRTALEWLKKHNPGYEGVQIDNEVINEYPECDVLPYHIEHIKKDENDIKDTLTSRYDNTDTQDSQDSTNIGENNLKPLETVFENVVITDVDGNATSNQLRAAAMRHIKQKNGGYIEVPHDPKPVNEFFNPDLFPMIYPTLYPFGLGGFEDSKREINVSLKRHTRHLFNLHDKRFQQHYSFMFTVFNVLQRRAILLHTSLKVKAKNFESVAAALNSISTETIEIVCERVAHGDNKTYNSESENHVLQLLKETNIVVSNVPGSSASRVAMRNQIRALIIERGLPSFYITINPADVFNPLVKFLAGSEIDIDALLPEEVPSYMEQSILVAKNPVIASKFFNIYMKAFIKNILQFDPESHENKNKQGILGLVNGYYGCVEAQGRGTLHCHMLVWLDGALNCEEIRDRVKSEDTDFQKRLIEFLDDTISNEIPNLPDPQQNVPSSIYNPCSVRGLNNKEFLQTENAQNEDLHYLVKNCQSHRHTHTCYKYWKGPPNPKECRFDLGEHRTQKCTYFDEKTGDIHLRCLDGLVNNFNATIIKAIRCNMDIKFIGSGPSTKAVIYYITDYITKSQLQSHVAFAALELAVRKLNQTNTEDDLPTVRAKKLLQKCAYAMVSHQELSAQQVSTYLMGYEDHFTSHEYKNIYWTGFDAYVAKFLPLKHTSTYPSNCEEKCDINFNQENSSNHDGCDSETIEDENEIGITSNVSGKIIPKSDQILDYTKRGENLKWMSLWDYVSRIEKITIKRVTRVNNYEAVDINPIIGEKNKETYAEILKNTAHTRPKFSFDKSHNDHDTHLQQLCQPSKALLPVPIGIPLPRRDQENELSHYHQVMLILFKPWCNPFDLIENAVSIDISTALANSFDKMISDHPDIAQKLNNIQALHDCKDSRDDHFQDRQNERKKQSQLNFAQPTEKNHNDDLFFADPNDIGDEILDHIESSESCRSEANNYSSNDANDCLRYAELSGMFNQQQTTDSMDTGPDYAQHIEIHDNTLEQIWAHEYETAKSIWKENMKNPNNHIIKKAQLSQPVEISLQNTSSCLNPEQINYPTTQPAAVHQTSNEHDAKENITDVVNKFSFNTEQARAFTIVAEHSTQEKPDQLRMFLGGAGGTGKSQVINGLRYFFQMKNQDRRFRLASFTGVAAHNIKGMTLHSALGLNQQKKGSSTHVMKDLIAMWEGVDYLFVDEVSMIGCHLLLKIHKALCAAKENTKPFGGINVVFAGDFAQLPPVGDTRLNSRINTQKSATNRGQNEIYGKLLWLSIDTCVLLQQIMRQQGPENFQFINLLQRLRVGACNEDDYKLLCSKLSYTTKPDWSQKLWNQAPIIVSNNEAKDKINDRCTRNFSATSKKELHYYHASDKQGGIVIDHDDLKNKLKHMHTGKTEQRMGLLPLVVGMPVMICANFDVTNGVVNGCIGTLKEIRYTVDENGDRHAHACVVSLPDVTGMKLTNLEIGEVAVLEDQCTMSFTNPHSSKRCSIKRTQLPIVPAFAITGHKSQGRTLPSTIADIQSCRGTESVYVMLSRVTSIENLRILRPFNIKKIQCRPSEDSRRESKRQNILNLRTIYKYGSPSERDSVKDNLSELTLSADPTSEDPDELEKIQKEMASFDISLPSPTKNSQLKRKANDNAAPSRMLKKRHIGR